MIELSQVSFAYHTKPILKGLSLNISEKSHVWIQGSNGSGKTTLLKLISGLLKPTEGSITKKGVSNLFLPEAGFYGELTVRENLLFYARLYQTPLNRIKTLSQYFQLDRFFDESFAYLSRGQKTRALLACVFLADVPIYLLDEPFSALDTQTRKALVSFIQNLKGKTLLLTSHEDYGLEGIGFKSVTLDNGQFKF